MKKQLVIFAVLLSFLFCMTAAAKDFVTVNVNGTKVESDVSAVLVNGSTMLPLRAVSNALGIKNEEIQWNQGSKSIEIRSGGKYIFLAVGATGALLDDSMITLNTAPYIENGTTLVPVRFVSEALGATVSWDGASKTVTITKN
jgi:hypothetical protein